MVHWGGLFEPATNGILLGYKVMLSPGNISLDITNPAKTSVEVTELLPETVYNVNVLGYNINGDGISKGITFKTKGSLCKVVYL